MKLTHIVNRDILLLDYGLAWLAITNLKFKHFIVFRPTVFFLFSPAGLSQSSAYWLLSASNMKFKYCPAFDSWSFVLVLFNAVSATSAVRIVSYTHSIDSKER